jgi:hypothetical protein
MDNQHFDKVFYFICGLVALVLLFDIAVIFVPVPQAGQKYADILVGSLNTGTLMAGVQYLLGGTPDKKPTDVTNTGNNPVITTGTTVNT